MYPNLKRKHAEDPDASAAPAMATTKKQKTEEPVAIRAKKTTKETAAKNDKAETEKPAAKKDTAEKKPAAAKGKPVTKEDATAKKAEKNEAAAPKKKASKKGDAAAEPAASSKKAAAPKKTEGKKDASAPAKKAATKKVATPKRKAEEETDGEAVKKPRTAGRVARPSATKKPAAKAAPVINEAPSRKLKVFVFGENGNGELGLGHLNLPDKKITNVTRPRLNPNLDPESVGVVQVAAGGMHVVALTHDNTILTWGVNDQGALGRETKGAEQLRDMDDEDSDGEYVKDANGNNKWPIETGLNSLEAAPGAISLENVPDGTVWTQVAAGDSVTMAVTNTGLVYGCGTFRVIRLLPLF